MKSVEKKKILLKHIIVGYSLIISGSLGLLFIVFAAGNQMMSQSKLSVLGTNLAESNNEENYPNSYGETKQYPNTYSDNREKTRRITPTPTPFIQQTANGAPTLPSPDSTSIQQIIDIINQQFTQVTPTSSFTNPTPTTAQNLRVPTNENETGNSTQTNSNNNSSRTQNANNFFQQTNNNSSNSNNQGQGTDQQIILPPASISSTQQTLNNVLKNENIHVKIENVGDKTIITATNNQGKVVNITNDLVDKLTDLLSEDTYPKIIKINASDYLIKKGTAVAETNYPLAFSQGDNIPVMSFGLNQKQITILPDQAALHVYQSDLLDTYGHSSFFRYMFPSYIPPKATTNMTLAPLNDQPVYSIPGAVKKQFLGILPISIPRTVLVAADTGIIQDVQETPFFSLLDKLSK